MFVFAADTHLAMNAWKSLPDVKGDSYRAFEQIIEFCVQNKAEALILGGDIFDASPGPDDVECFLRGVRKLRQAGICVWAIQGQHGRSRTIPWTSIDPEVYWLDKSDPRLLKGGGVVTGFDNMPGEELRKYLAALDPSVNIVILHQACRGSVPDVADRWDFDPDWVPPCVKLVLMGDIHEPWMTRREVKCNGLQHATEFYYSGSICMQSLNETSQKSFLVVDNGFNVTRAGLKTRSFEMLTILAESELAKVVAHAEKLEPETLVHVRFDPRVEKVEEMFRAANERVHYAFRPISIISVGNTDIDLSKLDQVSLEGCLGKMVDRTQDEEFHSFMLAMLKSKNPKNTLQDLRAAFLEKVACDAKK